MKKNVYWILGCLLVSIMTQADELSVVKQAENLVNQGNWHQAEQLITRWLLNDQLLYSDHQGLLFQKERMRRIRLDFKSDQNKTFKIMQEIVPAVDQKLFDRWDKQGSIESMTIDGQRFFFNRAGQNVFRVNPEALKLKLKHQPITQDDKESLKANINQIIQAYEHTGQNLVEPKRYRITYTVTVDSGVVPDGESVRAWLPFPREGGRQSQICLLETDPKTFWLVDTTYQQRSVYLEKKSIEFHPVVFKLVYEYSTCGFYLPIDPKKVVPVDWEKHPELKPWVEERLPHIAFTDTIKALSKTIVGQETNPYLKAKRFFQWISENVVWASAREYSTIESISHYPLRGWGDCGIQTLLFMTLCRSQSIPARWQSGWTTRMPTAGMHDWCQIYIEPYGWIPVDPSYGIMKNQNETLKWYYFGNSDSYRLVVNDDYSRDLYPAKTFFRSETVDFQRGELEYSGGNLYFNQWHWDYQVEEITR